MNPLERYNRLQEKDSIRAEKIRALKKELETLEAEQEEDRNEINQMVRDYFLAGNIQTPKPKKPMMKLTFEEKNKVIKWNE